MYEQVLLNTSFAQAREYLREAVAGHSGWRLPEAVALRWPVEGIEKTVKLEYERRLDRLRFDEPISVAWKPQGEEKGAVFAGDLVIHLDAYRQTRLELQGEFAPSAAGAGDVFDIDAGQKVASTTARVLLMQIARDMEEKMGR